MRPALLPASTLLTGLPQIADNANRYPLYDVADGDGQVQNSQLGRENFIS
jgi:hypothetical protein